MPRIQTQGVHHITLNGADRQTSIDFWEGVLGMPFLFEQPNLDAPEINHLYFDPGDGRLITIFTEESREPGGKLRDQVGSVHHLAFNVSLASWNIAVERLEERGISNSGPVDRGFMWSIYFVEPCGQRIELACYKFEPPAGRTHAEVLRRAHDLRVARSARSIEDRDIADAIEALILDKGQSISH
ncbi:VOC family protein [Rhodobacteraceae bacterium NNCM2]|nr:VOC family protein [Coraliihabitans acroporae]